MPIGITSQRPVKTRLDRWSKPGTAPVSGAVTTPGDDSAMHRASYSRQATSYWNPCLGMVAPIELESPRHFFGIQIAVGLASMLALVLIQ
jgi:hypothetical protein